MQTMPSNTPGMGRRNFALAVLLLFVFFCLPAANLRAALPNSGTFSMAYANIPVTADESDVVAAQGVTPSAAMYGVPIGVLYGRAEPLGAQITIKRTVGTAGRVKVLYSFNVPGTDTAVSSTDYTLPNPQSVVFENGQTYTNIFVPILANTASLNGTPGNFFTVTLSSAAVDPVAFNGVTESAANVTVPVIGAAASTVVTINPIFSPFFPAVGGVNSTAGFVTFGRAHYVRLKTQGSVLIPVFRFGLNAGSSSQNLPTSETVTYRLNSVLNVYGNDADNAFSLTPGSDYAYPGTNYVIQSTPGSITFGVNQAVAYIPVQIIDDPTVDQNLDIYITLDNSGSGPTSPNPRFVAQTGTAPATGLAMGAQSTCILTILAHQQANSAAEPQPAGAVDIGYNANDVPLSNPPYNSQPGANGSVNAVAVQPNQSTIIAGDFTSVNTTPINRIARMTANGQLDTSFNPQAGADSFINAVALQSNGAILIGGGFTSINGTSRNGIARLNSDGSLDTTFNPGSGINPGSVSASAIQSIALQSNGQIIIAGNFTSYNGTPINRIARLNSNGSLDATFNAGTGPNAIVYALAVQSDGNILLGGLFNAVNGTTLNGIARLTPTGSIDANFDPGAGVNGTIYALQLQSNGQILLGGSFTTIDLRNSPSIGRLNTDGSIDTTFNVGTGPNNTVYVLKYDSTSGNVYIGGLFTSYRTTPRLGVARLLTNGTLDTTFMDTVYNQFAGLWNPIYALPPNSCFSIDLDNSGNPLIGGSFTRVGGGATRSEARYRGNFCRLVGGSTPGPGHFEFTSPTYTMDELGGIQFVTVARNNGGYAQANVLANTSDGTAVSGVNYTSVAGKSLIWPSLYSTVTSFTGRRLADAVFGLNNDQEIGNEPWNNVTWTGIGTDNLNVTTIHDNKVTGNLVYNLTLTLPSSYQTIALGGGVLIPMGVALGRDSAVVTIVDDDFNYGDVSFSTPTYSYFENGGNAVITVYRTGGSTGTISVQYGATAGTAIANQDFTPVSGTLTFAPGQTNATFSVPLLDSLAYWLGFKTINLTLSNPTGGATVGGILTGSVNATIDELNNNPATGTPAGTVNTAFNSGVGADGNVLAVSYLNLPSTSLNRQWLIGGNFQNVGGLSRNYFSRLNKDGSPDSTMTNLTTAANGTVNAIAVYPDASVIYAPIVNLAGRIVVGGAFTTFNSTNRNYIARLNVDGGVDSAFNPGAGADNVIYAVAVVTSDLVTPSNNGKVIAVGDFASFNGTTRSHIVRLNTDGSVDNTFNPGQGADSSIRAVALDGNGKIIIGGDFSSYNATPISRVARLNSDGSLDTSFIVLPAAGAVVIPPGVNGRVRTVAVDFTNNVVIGGDFTTVSVTSTQTVNRIARLLQATGVPDATFNAGQTGADQPIYALTVEPDYKLIIAGDFAIYNGIGRTRIARLNTDGSLDPTINFGSGPNGFVASLALDTVSTNITIGGGFTQVDGLPRNYYAQLVSGANVGYGNFVFSSTNYNVFENGTNVAITVKRLGGLSNYVQVAYSSIDGTATNTVDYTNNPVTANLVFNPGQSIQTVTIGIIPGTATNVNRVFTNSLSNSTNNGPLGTTPVPDTTLLKINTTTNSTTTIINNNSMFNFSVANFSVVKSVVGGNAVITVNRDGGPVGTVTVNYATSNLTATTNDYTAVSGTLTFTNGQTSATFLVPILDNLLAQQDLTVLLTLSSPTGAAQLGGRATATLTIVNNTFAPGTLYFSSANYSFNESGFLATINVNRTNGNSGIITVGYATSDGTALAYPGTGSTLGYQYIGTNGTISFADGETNKSFTVTLIDNHVVEGNLTFNLTLINPTGGASLGSPNSAVVTILDNDFTAGTLNLSPTTWTTSEQIGTLTNLVVNRSYPTNGQVSVSVSTTDGTAIAGKDYLLLTNSLTWADQDGAYKIIPITIITQAVINPDRQFTVYLTNVTGGAGIGVGSCVVTIHTTNSGPGYFSFTAANYSAFESVGVAPITIIRTNGTTGQVSIVLTNAGGGTAVAGVDYTNNFSVNPASTTSGFPVTIVFTNGQATQTVNLGIIDRHILDGDRTLNLQLSIVHGDLTAPNLGTGTNSVFTILDDSPAAGSIDTSFVPNTGPNNKVNALAVQSNGKVVIGGDFTTVDSPSRNHIARLNSDGTVDTAFNPGTGVTTANGTVRSVGIQSDGKVVFGGLFTTVSGLTRNNLARLNSDGSMDASFTGNFANNPVNAVAIQTDGNILVGGNFTSLSGTNWNFVGRVTTNGAPDTAFNPGAGPNAQVRAIALQPDGKIVIGGDFTSFNGVACNYIARLNSDGTLDNTFSSLSGPNKSVYALAVQLDGRIVVGGAFTGVGTNSVPYLARLNANGINDAATFSGYTNADNIVSSISMDATSRIIIGGSFANVNGLSRSGITRLNPDGSVDLSLNTGAGANGAVTSVAYESFDGKIILGGGFTAFDGTPRNYVARLNGGSNPGSGSVDFSSATYTYTNGSPITITVLRHYGLSNAVSVAYTTLDGTAIGGSNYVSTSGILNIPAGVTSTNFPVSIIDANRGSVNQTVNLALLNPTNATLGTQPTSVLTIEALTSALSFTVPAYSVIKNGGSATITVARTGSSLGINQVHYATSDNTGVAGTDYTATSGNLNWADGDTAPKTFTVPIINNSVTNGNKTVNLTLSNPQPAADATLGLLPNATLTIIDNLSGPGTFNIVTNSYTVNEANTSLLITVIRTNGYSGAVSVNYATGGGTDTAVAGNNYVSTSGTLSFADGEPFKTFTVQILATNNVVLETNDTFFTITLSGPTGGASLGSTTSSTVTIKASDCYLAFTAPSYNVNEAAGIATVTVQRIGGLAGAVSLSISAQTPTFISAVNTPAIAGVDFISLTTNVTISAGATSFTFQVPIIDNLRLDGSRDIEIDLYNISTTGNSVTNQGATNVLLTIIDNDFPGGLVDNTFNLGSGPNTNVNAMVLQADSKVIIGGEFTLYNGATVGRLARVNTNGILDAAFSAGIGANNTINALALDNNTVLSLATNVGKAVVGGLFTTYNGAAANRIARLNLDGTLDNTFNAGAGPNNSVFAVAVQGDGKVLVGGLFSSVGGVSRNFLARLNTDGSVDTSFMNAVTGPNNSVRSIAVDQNGNILIGGNFTVVNGQTRTRLARLNPDGSLDTTFLDPSILTGYATLGADGTVFAVYPYPTTGTNTTTGDVLIGGQFSNFNGQVANHLVRLDSTGQVDPSFHTGTSFGADDFISTLLVQQYMQSAGHIMVGGGFANFNGVPSGGIARLKADGTLDPTINFGSGFNDVVSALAERVDGRLYVGGNFTSYNGTALNHLAVLQAGLNTDNGRFDFSSDTYDFVKGTGTNYITVVRSSGLAGAVSVDYTDLAGTTYTATNGVTYNFTAGTLQFTNGQAIGTIPINILSANVVDAINPRVAGLMLSNPVGGATIGVTNYAVVDIFDNNSGVDFLVHDFSVSENGGFAVISVQRTGGTNSIVTVNYSTILGGTAPLTEYVSASGTLTFNPGETLKTFNVTIKDILLAGDQTVYLQLSNPTGPNVILGTNSPAVLTIFSDVVSVGALGFSTNAVSVNDSSTLLPVTVIRTGGNTGPAKVSYTTGGGTAIAGTDYAATSGTLSFADGDTVKTFNIPILRNIQITGNRHFNVTLSNPTGGATLSTSSAVVTIIDVDGVIQFSSPTYTVSKTNSSAAITVNCSGVLTTNIIVTATTSNGSANSGINYQSVTTNLTFGPGTNSVVFNVPIINDGQPDGNQTVNLSLSGLTGLGFFGPVTNAVLTIQEVYSGVMFSTASYSVNESGGLATISINRNGATNTTVGVNFSTSNGSAVSGSNYVSTNGTLTFGPGVTSQTFSVQVLDDQIVTPTLTVNLALNLPTGGAILIAPSSAVLNLLNSDVNYQFSTNSYSVLKTGANVQITVLRTGLINQATSVNFSTSNGTAISGVDYSAVNQVLNFGVGVTSRVVTVPIINDGIPTGNLFANLTLSNPTVGTYLGSPAQATLNIVDTITLIQFTAATNSVLEGTTNAMVYVSRFGATNLVNTVDYFTTAGTATAGLDYAATNGTLTFAPGQTNQLIQVPILDDMLPEQTETLTVSLTNPTGGATLGAVTNSTVRIVDNDRIGSLDSNFEPGTGSTNTVYAITTQFGTNVIAGGNFRYLNGVSRNRLARLLASGAVDLTFTNSFADNIIYAVAEQPDGRLLVGGAFASINGVACNGLARLNADGSLDTNFVNHLSANAIVLSIAVSTDTNSVNVNDVAIGGQFTAVDINSKTNINIALVNTNGAINTNFTAQANDLVEVVTFDQNSNALLTANVGKVLVGGFFTQINSLNAAQLARLNTDGSVDGTFIPAISPGARVYAIAVQPDGNVLVAGAFTAFNGVSHNNIARLDAFGTVASFNNTGTDSTVYTMSLQSNGRVVIGGDFAYVNGVGRSHFARLNSNGTLDATFDPGTGLDNTVYSVATQPDGKVLLAGAFTTYDGISRNGVARANGDHGQFQFAVSTLSILKSAGPAVIQVTRLGGSSGIASVNFSTSNGTNFSPAIAGTDYTATNGVLIFADSVTNAFITVPIINNTVVQPNHDFAVTLSNPTNSTLGSITNLTVTIVNDASSLQLSTNAISINEDQASITLTVNRAGYLNSTGTVNYATAGGNAVPSVNYTSTSGTLTFGTNVASQTITIPIIHDLRVTGNKTFNLVLSGTSGQAGLITPSSCTVTVVDVDSYLQFATATTLSNETQPDGSTNSVTLSVVRIGATNSAVSVQVYTADGTGVANTQYLPIAPPLLLTFLAGQATNYVTVTNLHDFQLGNKTYNVILATPSNRGVLGNPATNVVTIVDSDSSLSFAATNYTVVKSAGSVNVTLLRGGSTNEQVAVTAYTLDGTAHAPGKYTAVTTKLTFNPGVVSQTFSIPIVPNNIIDGTQSFTVGLEPPTTFGIITPSPSTTATVTILDNNYISLLAAGTALISESYYPTNGAINPNEVVTVNFGLRNAGNVNTTNVVATLLSTNGIIVNATNAVQSFGPLIGGGATVFQPFTFQAVGPTLTATFQLNDIDMTNHITNNIGIVSFPLAFGSTKSFTNSALMNIPATLSLPGYGPASIYPSPITVSSLTGKVSKVTVTLNRLTHTFPQDISMLLVSPTGEKSLLISREGGGNPVANVVLTMDGSPGIAPPTQAQLVTGSYAPASSGIGETFSTPAPTGPYVADLTVFTNINPNGVWSLYVYDNANVDYGSMGGWTLNLTTIIAPAADLSLTLVPSANTVLVGNNVLYTMTVSNQGPNTATGVLLTNTYPAGVALVSATNSQGVLNTNTSGLIWCALGNLSSGAVATVTTVLSPAAPGTINSYGSVVANQSDPNLTNNTASVSVIAAGVFLSSTGYQPQQGQFGLTLSGVQGRSYVIQVSTNLIDWLPINTNVVAAEYFNFTDTNSPSFRQRFYRAIEQ